ncbi:BrxA/BrxB family bacilliredoxin [Mammaliicoccus sciuri]|uniref:BrxA/BrxB family bacilliredoxin n=1 Tax=Mammaliicoccus sciuri TaxID=1296 RepID=UPI002DBE79AE|nr:BrxA/BrxB family bacilliredoxin [Mammaliicoccus sciuri]MEB6233260.1 BrxA/BrxB family bacilliredoxin [Mammaliicoccus sciuri]
MEMDFNLYMNDVVNSARNEIEAAGYKQLTTKDEVEETFNKPGTTFVMVNSVCGCAGGIARPAAQHALHYDKLPNQLVTVFAGQDKEATETAREYFEGYPPSSPSFSFLKDGKIVKMIERHEIEGHDPMSVITNIQALFEEYCEEV